jgi:hypothetical protein
MDRDDWGIALTMLACLIFLLICLAMLVAGATA